MKKSRFTESQIVQILKEADADMAIIAKVAMIIPLQCYLVKSDRLLEISESSPTLQQGTKNDGPCRYIRYTQVMELSSDDQCKIDNVSWVRTVSVCISSRLRQR